MVLAELIAYRWTYGKSTKWKEAFMWALSVWGIGFVIGLILTALNIAGMIAGFFTGIAGLSINVPGIIVTFASIWFLANKIKKFKYTQAKWFGLTWRVVVIQIAIGFLITLFAGLAILALFSKAALA